MRQALPNAAFMGFTGTPLIAGEELTRQQFGDYVSDLQLPRRHRGRRDRPALLREPHPRAAARQRGLRRRARPRCWRRPSSTRTPRASSRAGSAASTRCSPGPSGCAPSPATSSRTSSAAASPARRCTSGSTRPPRCACTTRAGGVGRAPRRAAGPARRAAGAGAAVAGQPHRADGDHRHGGRRLARARTRSPTSTTKGLDIRPHRARMNARGPRRAVQGRRRPAAARVRLRDVDDRVRRPERVDDLPRPADAQPHADADDRPRQPGVPRQGQRADRRLHRRVPEPREGARHLRRRQRRGRRRLADPGQRRDCVAALAEAVDGGRRAVRALRRRPRRAADGDRASSSSPCATPPSRRCSSTRSVRTDVPRRRAPGPQAVQGAAARPGRRRPAAHRRRDPGAGRADRRRRPAAGSRPRRRSPTPSTRCSTGRSAPRSTSSGPPPRAASPTR